MIFSVANEADHLLVHRENNSILLEDNTVNVTGTTALIVSNIVVYALKGKRTIFFGGYLSGTGFDIV